MIEEFRPIKVYAFSYEDYGTLRILYDKAVNNFLDKHPTVRKICEDETKEYRKEDDGRKHA
jgi:hypothetical protein